MCRQQNLEFLGLKVTQQSLLLLFTFLSSFFYSAVHLVGFILVGNVFSKAFRILGLDERIVGGYWNKIGSFQVNVT